MNPGISNGAHWKEKKKEREKPDEQQTLSTHVITNMQ